MPNSENKAQGILADVTAHLSGIFRHMLPGVIVIGAAILAYPCWFNRVDFNSWPHLLLLTVIAIAAGNIWFALNRYGIYQVFDYFLYLFKINGPSRGERSQYLDDLGQYIYRSMHTSEASARARQHVAFRASTGLLICTLGELAFFIGIYHSEYSSIKGYEWELMIGGIITFSIGIWQMILSRRFDYYVTNPEKINEKKTHAVA